LKFSISSRIVKSEIARSRRYNQPKMTPDWKQWEGDIAGGEFPLDEILTSGEAGAVFRSGSTAIKLVRGSRAAVNQTAERWNRAAAVEHPGLIRILKAGFWLRGKTPVAFCAMELAEENLGAVLAERPLTEEETREMLLPLAETLAFLHAQGLAHGRVKASNVLAVKDTLKLSSDSIAAGDPPGDVRDLGALVVAALGGDRAKLPSPFDTIAQNSLEGKSSAGDVVDRLRGKAEETTHPAKKLPPARYAIAFAILLIGVIAMGTWWREHAGVKTGDPAPKPAPVQSAPVQPAPVAAAPPQPTEKTAAQVVERALPAIPPKARRTIRGTAKVAVKVAVDAAGEVTDAKLEPGGSRYFGKYAIDAARRWRFAQGSAAGDWRLRFEITQAGTKAFAEPEESH
jgi:TonB family protein